MARGIGERTPRYEIQFCELPEQFQQWYEAEAVAADGREGIDFWDLEPAVRRAVRQRATDDWMKGVRK